MDTEGDPPAPLASDAMAGRDSRVVWSSGDGDLRKARGPAARPAGGGRVKVRRETGGRRGKTVTTIANVPLDDAGCARSPAG